MTANVMNTWERIRELEQALTLIEELIWENADYREILYVCISMRDEYE